MVDMISVMDSAFGVAGDAKWSKFGSCARSSNLLNVSDGNFTGADVGKAIVVSSIGTTGGDAGVGTITAVNSATQVQMSFSNAHSGTDFTDLRVNWGTDDTAAFNGTNGVFAALRAEGTKLPKLVWDAGGYLAEGFNLTDITDLHIEGRGGVNNQLDGNRGTFLLPLSGDSRGFFDLTGCTCPNIDRIQVGHQFQAQTGRVAVLRAKSNLHDAAGGTFDRIMATGYWKNATWMMYGVTTDELRGCSAGNYRHHASGMIISVDNVDVGHGQVTSAYATMATGIQGCGDITLIAGGYSTNMPDNSGYNTRPAVWIRGANAAAWRTKFNNSGDYSTGIMSFESVGGKNPGFSAKDCNFYPENNTTPVHGLYIPYGSVASFCGNTTASGNGWTHSGARVGPVLPNAQNLAPGTLNLS